MANTDVIQVLSLCHAADIPALLVGPPGVGKSAMVRALAQALGKPLVDLRGNSLDRADLVVPVVRRGRLAIEATPLLRQACEEPVVLFLDELTTASEAVQAVMLQVVLDRRVQTWSLHPETWVVAACNNLDEAPGATPLAPPTIGRFCVIQVRSSHARWIAWAKGERVAVEALPWRRGAEVDRARDLVVQFLEDRPECLNSYRPDQELEPGIPAPWPCERSWEFAWRLMAAAGPGFDELLSDKPGELATALRVALAGVIGAEMTASFVGWVRDRWIDPRPILEAAARGDLGPAKELSLALWPIVWREIARLAGEEPDETFARGVENLVEWAKVGPCRDAYLAVADDLAERLCDAGRARVGLIAGSASYYTVCKAEGRDPAEAADRFYGALKRSEERDVK